MAFVENRCEVDSAFVCFARNVVGDQNDFCMRRLDFVLEVENE